MGVLLLCGVAAAAEPSPEVTSRRVTPEGALFSIELPAAPTCDPKSEQPDCRYDDPKRGWILRTSYKAVEVSGTPAEFLQKQLADSAGSGGFRIERQEATRVGEFPAIDYHFESLGDSAYRSAGRLVLIGTQLVNIEVDGDPLPAEEVIQHFVSTFRVKGSSEKPGSPVQAGLSTKPSVAPDIAMRLQVAILKPSVLQYSLLQEKLPTEGMPASFSVGTLKRNSQHKRDKKRDAFIITETGRAPEGKIDNRVWIDAKTLLPYRWVSHGPGTSIQLEVIDGSLRGEIKGATATQVDQPVGDTPLWFPGAPLELAISTLPLAREFTGSVQVLEPGGLATGKPFSTWSLSVPFVGPITGLSNLKQSIAGYKVELLEQTEGGREPRRIILWIESEQARRVLQVESLTPSSSGESRTVQTIQSSR